MTQNRKEAAKKLNFFIFATQTSELKEFQACLTMLGNWSKYILNAFDCKYTNGYTEGTNNAIKVIKRNAFGYRNFDNFRNRIMCNIAEDYTGEEIEEISYYEYKDGEMVVKTVDGITYNISKGKDGLKSIPDIHEKIKEIMLDLGEKDEQVTVRLILNLEKYLENKED